MQATKLRRTGRSAFARGRKRWLYYRHDVYPADPSRHSSHTPNVQGGYQAGAAASALSLVLLVVAGAIITSVGKKALFRGIPTSGHFGKIPSKPAVALNPANFAVRGINSAIPTAFTVGLASDLLFHRTRPI